MNTHPRLSVVIPCYNHGRYVDEAVDSVLAQTFQDFEIIIVNDGSTDPETVKKLRAYNKPKTRVLHTPNRGLSEARNAGIREASGEYILPLDADDRIAPTYAEQAIRVLDEHERVGIVYCEAEFFGSETGRWPLPPYNFPGILTGNMIFCSAFFRRSDWELTGGYRLRGGWEDYDFWLSLIELGREVVQLPEVLFYYRRRPDSMAHEMTDAQQIEAHATIFRNHPELYAQHIGHLFSEIYRLRDDAQRLSGRESVPEPGPFARFTGRLKASARHRLGLS